MKGIQVTWVWIQYTFKYSIDLTRLKNETLNLDGGAFATNERFEDNNMSN